ncbi:MAG: hypothetical protein K8R48_10095 [Alphaproteobacteria bacterium]|nr:hypothetical protein [Alphaproteobacteria bacterium]
MAKKLFVRFSTSQDEKAIFDFYAQNQHQFVFQRDPEVWKERIASGAVTLIHDDTGKIVASSIAYPIIIKDANGNDIHQWTELGSARVQLDGIGLAKTLISAMVLRAYLLEPPNDRFVLEIVLGNSHSKHVFTKMGATPYNIPPELQQKVKATIASGSGQAPVEWFQMGVELMPLLAQNVMESIKNPIVKNAKTGEEYELDFSRCALITQFQKEIKDLALKDFGDVKNPNLKHGLKSFKNKFNP